MFKGKRELREIKGIAFYDKKLGKTIITERRERIKNLDELPFPLRKHLPMEKYCELSLTYPAPPEQKYASISASRGCPYSCTFCTANLTWGGRMLIHRSPKNIVDELEYLKKKYKINYFWFRDESFTTNKKWIKELMLEMIERNLNLKWYAFGRINELLDTKLLKLMKKAGCFELAVGVESGDESILNDINKNTTNLQTIQAFENLERIGIHGACLLMIGMPNETHESLQNTFKLVSKIPFTRIRVAYATPYPGTVLHSQCISKNLLLTKNLKNYTTEKPIIKCRTNIQKLKNFRIKIFNLYFSEEYKKRAKKDLQKKPYLKKSYDWWFDFLKKSFSYLQ